MKRIRILVWAVFGFLTLAAPLFAASKEKVLYSFCPVNNGCTDGKYPQSSLIFDAAGNLYGTAAQGGAYRGGTVFKLTPNTNGTWTETVLYNFNILSTGGNSPSGNLIFDTTGNLYGTTNTGGVYNGGTAFELMPNGDGTWTETVLHSFGEGNDGFGAVGGLIFDAAGNLYGATGGGGIYNSCGSGYDCGTVFELMPNGDGTWTETVLHSFGEGNDGFGPVGGLIFDAAGNLYSATVLGGAYDYGTAFELSPSGNGTWTETILHNFNDNGKDGWSPYIGLVLDTVGNLYGTTFYGGARNGGTVFELSPEGNGKWKKKTLHSFSLGGTGGYFLFGGLIFDDAGNLYGTTYSGGDNGKACNYEGCGTVFQLVPGSNGTWKETVLFRFNSKDGAFPMTSLIFDAAGNLYGTTFSGGNVRGPCEKYGCGTVFEITP